MRVYKYKSKDYFVYQDKKEFIDKEIKKGETILDVGFWGEPHEVTNWPHLYLLDKTRDLYGLDLNYDRNELPLPENHYKECSAEDFKFDILFDTIFAGDLIEHLPNPGLFLRAAKKNLKPNGRLIITTPNCYEFFNIMGKLTKIDPAVNNDHTCYFDTKTIRQLLKKEGWNVHKMGYLHTLHSSHKESWKKKTLNQVYRLLSVFTPKYLETIVVVAVNDNQN